MVSLVRLVRWLVWFCDFICVCEFSCLFSSCLFVILLDDRGRPLVYSTGNEERKKKRRKKRNEERKIERKRGRGKREGVGLHRLQVYIA